MVTSAGKRSFQLDALSICVKTRTPCLLWGDPGIGKTSSVVQLAANLGLHLETVIAAIREPTDFAGLPFLAKRLSVKNRQLVVKTLAAKLGMDAGETDANLVELLTLFGTPHLNSGVVSFAPPLWAKNLIEKGQGILFLDEISTARPAVQTALLRVVLEGVVGDLKLPDGVSVVAAANPPDQIAGGWDLTAPLANRFVHLDWKLDADRWVDGFTYGWPMPEILAVADNWPEKLSEIKPVIGAFIKTKPEALHNVPTVETQKGRAWPSPRSWEMGAKLLAATEAVQLSGDDRRELQISLLKGAVGGVALEYVNYRDNLDLPNPEDLLANPSGCELPTRDDRMYAALASVVFVVKRNATADRWQRAWKVLERAATSGPKDVAMSHAYHLAKARPQGAAAPPMKIFHAALVAAGIVGSNN